ncbi:MAG: cation transporter [Flavobacteriaceae bacterium]|nr:cation diffusion facilitator family transporter [Bacteroidia bacterium]MBT8286613.1 cation diffusion facilitator family transporter [Bacteroidia bacterium]NNF75138.1 cation transporter [Flavobacteriaceae bacterium]NNK72154.1 cation transporter [Flavobacteriaceae bacterium]
MGHAHNHNHLHQHQFKGKNLLISIVLNLVITIAQVIGGFVSGSISLLSDALHNLSDVVSLVVSYIAARLSRRSASLNRTFGFKRAEILAAFVNAAALVVIAIFLIIEAIERFRSPVEIESDIVIWLSLLGIVVNGLSVLLLRDESKKNMNMRSAYLHLFTDMLASIAVLIGGLLMKFYELFWVDSLLTLAIAVYLIFVGYDLLKESFKVLMLFTPNHIAIQNIVKEVQKLDRVKNIHHIHVWQLNEEEIHLEAHVDLDSNIAISEFNLVLADIEKTLFDKFNINHVNIQPEYDKPDSKDVIIQD